jgi:hypothetical protein
MGGTFELNSSLLATVSADNSSTLRPLDFKSQLHLIYTYMLSGKIYFRWRSNLQYQLKCKDVSRWTSKYVFGICRYCIADWSIGTSCTCDWRSFTRYGSIRLQRRAWATEQAVGFHIMHIDWRECTRKCNCWRLVIKLDFSQFFCKCSVLMTWVTLTLLCPLDYNCVHFKLIVNFYL